MDNDFSDWIVISLPKEEKPVKAFAGFLFCKRRIAHFFDGLTSNQQNSQELWAHNHRNYHGHPIEGQLIDAQGQPLSYQPERSHYNHWHHKTWPKGCNHGKNEAVIETSKEGN